MAKTQHLIKLNQIHYFTSLFNRGGYVLNFSTLDFDKFTLNSIGIALCQEYGLSKGRSLENFCLEGEERLVITLLNDLLEYYETWYQHELNPEDKSFSKLNYDLYQSCKRIIMSLPNNNTHIIQFTAKLKERFSSEYLTQQINLMIEMKEQNPTESIGKSKELIETCCKNILENENVIYDSNSDVNTLIKLTMKTLNIHADCITNSTSEAKNIKKILGSLAGIASSIAELRNSYGSGHGKNVNYQGLSSRHAELAMGTSVTLVKYLWDTYEWKKNNK